MGALPNRAQGHKDQIPKGEAPSLPNPNSRVGAATSTSRRLRIFCRNLDPGPVQDPGRNRTVAVHNIFALRHLL